MTDECAERAGPTPPNLDPEGWEHDGDALTIPSVFQPDAICTRCKRLNIPCHTSWFVKRRYRCDACKEAKASCSLGPLRTPYVMSAKGREFAKNYILAKTVTKRRRSIDTSSAPKRQRKSQGPNEAESSARGALAEDDHDSDDDTSNTREIAELVLQMIQQRRAKHDDLAHRSSVHYANLACAAVANDTDIVSLRDAIRQDVDRVMEERIYPMELRIAELERELEAIRYGTRWALHNGANGPVAGPST